MGGRYVRMYIWFKFYELTLGGNRKQTNNFLFVIETYFQSTETVRQYIHVTMYIIQKFKYIVYCTQGKISVT